MSSSPPEPTPVSPSEVPSADAREERLWAGLCHLVAFAGLLFPLGNILCPLVVWLLKKDQFPLVDDQGKESMNFQISILIYTAVAALLIVVCVGLALLPVLLVYWIVMLIVATIKAADGVRYRYPLTIRFIQ